MVDARLKSTQVPVSCLWKAECTIELVPRKLALMAIKNYWPVWGKFKQTMFRIWDVKQNKWNVYCNGLTVKGIVPQDCGFFIKSTWAPDQRIKIFTILVKSSPSSIFENIGGQKSLWTVPLKNMSSNEGSQKQSKIQFLPLFCSTWPGQKPNAIFKSRNLTSRTSYI